MSDKVAVWRKELGLNQYAATFEKKAVGYDILPELADVDLKEIGIDALGHREKILQAITALQPEQSSHLPLADKPASGKTEPHRANKKDINAWTRIPGERKPVRDAYMAKLSVSA